jgi:hypothetical protein
MVDYRGGGWRRRAVSLAILVAHRCSLVLQAGGGGATPGEESPSMVEG